MLILILLYLLSKTQKYLFLRHFISKSQPKNHQKFLAKGLKDQCVGMNIKKTISEKKDTANKYICFFWFKLKTKSVTTSAFVLCARICLAKNLHKEEEPFLKIASSGTFSCNAS